MSNEYITQDLYDNLNYLNETKEQIKQAIIDKGQDVSESDTFRSYADKIRNIEGSGGGGVKLFATEEEMNNSTGNKEGDLAVVYSSSTSNITADTQFQTAKFPSTVVLPSAFTDAVEVRFQAVDSSQMFDCYGQLDSSTFMMQCYTESTMITITYESSDGVTYVRTDNGEETVDFGLEIKFSGTWNDAIGYFIRIEQRINGGLYEYNTKEDLNQLQCYDMAKVTYENSTITVPLSENYLNIETIQEIINDYLTDNTGYINYVYTGEYHYFMLLTGYLSVDNFYYDYTNNKLYWTIGSNWSNYASYFAPAGTKVIKIKDSDKSVEYIDIKTLSEVIYKNGNKKIDELSMEITAANAQLVLKNRKITTIKNQGSVNVGRGIGSGVAREAYVSIEGYDNVYRLVSKYVQV